MQAHFLMDVLLNLMCLWAHYTHYVDTALDEDKFLVFKEYLNCSY